MENIFRYCKVFENCGPPEFEKFYQDKFLSDPELIKLVFT